MSSPAAVVEHLQQQRWEPALDALLAAWRSHRCPQLEAPLRKLGDWLAGGVEPIDVEAEGWQEQWEDRARAKRPVDLAVLLPLLTELPKGAIPRRLKAVIAFGPDPRTGALMVEMIETPPLTASSNFSMWTELFAALPSCADQRVEAQLKARMASRGGKSQFWTKLQAWIKAVLPKLPAPTKLPKGWKAELTELNATLKQLTRGSAPTLAAAEVETPPTLETVDDLAPARKRLEAGDLRGGLDLLVGYWAQRRSPEVAALIDRLATLVDPELPAIFETQLKQKAKQDTWLEAGEHPAPHMVGALLACLRDGKLGDVEQRLDQMTQWLPDPRVAQTLLVLTKDYMLGARTGLWRGVYQAMVVHADPRIADDVRKRHDRLDGANVLHRHIAEGREIRRVYAAFNQAVEGDHALSRPQQVHADAIAEILAKHVAAGHDDDQTERTLMREILADWEADEPRLVYSDWLQSRHDARGEFIALDVALAQGKSVKGARNKYWSKHKNEIFGPLAGLLSWGEAFERGLLTTARIYTRKGGLDVGEDKLREILGDLRWASIRDMDVSYDDVDAAEVFARAPLWSLRSLSTPGLAAMAGFARRQDTIPLRVLEVSADEQHTREEWQAFGDLARVLPEVEELEIMIWGRQGGRVTPPLACFEAQLVRRTKLLFNGSETTGGVARIDQWIERLVETECPVPTLRLIGPELNAECRQVELGRFEIDLSIDRLRWADENDTVETLAAVRGLDRGRVTLSKLEIGTIHASVRPRLDAALEGLR